MYACTSGHVDIYARESSCDPALPGASTFSKPQHAFAPQNLCLDHFPNNKILENSSVACVVRCFGCAERTEEGAWDITALRLGKWLMYGADVVWHTHLYANASNRKTARRRKDPTRMEVCSILWCSLHSQSLNKKMRFHVRRWEQHSFQRERHISRHVQVQNPTKTMK